MKKVWIVVGIVAALVLAAGTAAYVYPTTTSFKNFLAAKAKSSLGRDVEFKGRTWLQLRPTLTLHAENVTVHNPPGSAGAPLLQAAAVEIDLSLSFPSWLAPRLDYSAARIDAPKVLIAFDRDGRSNLAGPATASATAKTASPFSLGTVSLAKGSLTYTDARSGASEQLEDFSAKVVQLSPTSPISATFDVTWRKERINGTAALPTLNAILVLDAAREPLRAVLTLSAKAGRAEFDVSLAPGQDLSITSKSRVDIQSLNELSKWIGADPDALGSGALSLTGEVAIRPAPAPAPSASGTSAQEAPQGAARGWQVVLSNGDLLLGDACDRPQCKVEKISASALFSTLAAPFETSADLTWNGERIEAHARLQSLEALLARASSRATLRLASTRDQLEFDGDVDRRQQLVLRGRAKGGTANLRKLAAFLGYGDPPFGGGLEIGKLEGDLSATPGKIEFRNARFSIDDTIARGDLTYDYVGRAMIGGRLALDRLDIGRYDDRFGEATAKSTVPAPQSGSSAARRPADKGGHNPFATLESVPFKDALKAHVQALESGRSSTPGAIEAPTAIGNAWSEDSLGLDALKQLNLDLNLDLAVNELKVAGRALAVPQLKTLLKDGRLSLEWRDLLSHGGKIRGQAHVDSRSAAPTVNAELTAEGVEVEQVFADLGLDAFLAGKAALETKLTANARSQKALVSSLSGSLKASASEASLVGWDLRRSWRNIFSGLFRGDGPAPYDPRARTPVDRVVADVRIENGVAKTATEAQVRGPAFAAVGEGTARLLSRQTDYRASFSTFVDPEVKIDFKGAGPWTAAKPEVDLDGGGMINLGLAYLRSLFSPSGAQLESMSDPEMIELFRRYVDASEKRAPSSDTQAAGLRELRQLLGPAKQ